MFHKNYQSSLNLTAGSSIFKKVVNNISTESIPASSLSKAVNSNINNSIDMVKNNLSKVGDVYKKVEEFADRRFELAKEAQPSSQPSDFIRTRQFPFKEEFVGRLITPEGTNVEVAMVHSIDDIAIGQSRVASGYLTKNQFENLIKLNTSKDHNIGISGYKANSTGDIYFVNFYKKNNYSILQNLKFRFKDKKPFFKDPGSQGTIMFDIDNISSAHVSTKAQVEKVFQNNIVEAIFRKGRNLSKYPVKDGKNISEHPHISERVCDLEGGQKIHLKRIKLDENHFLESIDEVSHLLDGTCANCLQYYGAYRYEDYLYIASEYGGSFLSTARLKRNFKFTTQYVIQMLEQGKQLADNGLIHTNLKIENMVLSDDLSTVKIMDYSVAQRAPSGFYSKQGTPYTIAPEVYHKVGHIPPEDMNKIHTYSLGMVILDMLTNFKNNDLLSSQYLRHLENKEANDFLLDEIYQVQSPHFDHDEIIDTLKSMTHMDINQRITITEALDRWKEISRKALEKS